MSRRIKNEISRIPETKIEDMTPTQLAINYKNNDCEQSGVELLERFDPTVRVFSNIFYYGRYIKKKQVKNFMNLLVSPKDPNSEAKIRNLLKVFSIKYSTACDYEDIVQDIKLSILQTAKRYEFDKIKREFEYFFDIYFKYILKKNTVDRLDSAISTDFYEDYLSHDSDLKSTINGSTISSEYEAECFVENGTNHELLKHLTKEERQLLKRYFIDERTLHDLADNEYDITYSAISLKIKRIKEKIDI